LGNFPLFETARNLRDIYKQAQQNVIIVEVTMYEMNVNLYGQQNTLSFYTVLKLEVTMYEMNVNLYGQQNTFSFYTVLKFSQKKDSGLVYTENWNAVSVKSCGS